MALGVIKIFIALAILTILAFKGMPILLAGLIAAIVFLAITDPANIYTGLTTTFMAGAASFVQAYFLTFLGGALFGTVVEMSGAAESIAKAIIEKMGDRYIVIGIIIATAILTMGGVSVYVAFFAIYPFAMSLFKRADIPRKLFAAAYMVGGGTFTMTGPFSPAIQNIIPTKFLGTSVSAAALPGVIGMAFCFILGSLYMHRRQNQCRKNGEHFIALKEDTPLQDDTKRPPVIIAILPMVLLLVFLNAVKLPIEVSLLIAVISGFILYFPYYPHNLAIIFKKLGEGTSGAVVSILNTGSTVGFGKVISSSAVFSSLIPIVTGIGGNPLVGAAVSTGVLAGLSGSASGGLGIAIPIVAEVFLPRGLNPQALHRVASVASSSLDSLPHNGGVVTFLNYSKTTHKEGYKDVFIVSVVITTLQLILVIALIYAFGMAYA